MPSSLILSVPHETATIFTTLQMRKQVCEGVSCNLLKVTYPQLASGRVWSEFGSVGLQSPLSFHNVTGPSSSEPRSRM